MDWLALHLPTLPLDAVADALPDFHDKAGHKQPLGIIESGRLIALSCHALAAGAHITMTLAAASSLAPGLVAVPRQPHREAALLHRLALALSECTPSIVIEPDGLRLELSSTLRLFGGRAVLLRRLETIVRECGIEQLQFAEASTPAAASLLARATANNEAPARFQRTAPSQVLTQRRLDQLPINTVLSFWSHPRALLDLLQGIGCHTLRDLRALPRGGLTRRGGRELMGMVARAYGDEPDPQVMFEPPPTFELGLELMHRADEAGALVFAAQRLVQPLIGWLAARWLAASRLSLKLRHETSRRREQPDTILEIELAQPSRDAAQIMLLMRERLHRMSLPAPVYAIALRLDDAVSHAGRAGALWASPMSQQENARVLVDRLSARLGSDRVQRVQLCSDHRPERAMRWLSAQAVDASAHAAHARLIGPRSIARADRAEAVEAALPCNHPVSEIEGRGAIGLTTRADPEPAAPPSTTGPLRPAWLLAEPLPLGEDGARPIFEGKPLVIISRAERIEAGWFDDALASRDYHIAVGADVCCWIYRERRVDAPARWFLHGIFG